MFRLLKKTLAVCMIGFGLIKATNINDSSDLVMRIPKGQTLKYILN